MIQELIEKLNNQKILQTDFYEDQEELQEFFENWIKIESGLDIETHRWYELSTTVFKHKSSDSYIGMEHITNIFSEQMGLIDCYIHYEFFEMEPIQTITYKRKV